jgi:hypothetical protein
LASPILVCGAALWTLADEAEASAENEQADGGGGTKFMNPLWFALWQASIYGMPVKGRYWAPTLR